MAYDIFNPGSVDQAFTSKSVFNRTQDDERKADEEAFVKQANLLANIPIDYTGNIDLAHRPQVPMPDGSVATVRSMSFNDNGKERLIPTISQSGQVMSPEQAIAEYQRTGQHLGLFDSPAAATAMAQRIHDQQASGMAPETATQVAAQGAAAASKKLTPEEYQMGVISYLMNNRGYSYEDAARLMAPRIAMYKLQDAAEKQKEAEVLAGQLNAMDITSPEYRAGVVKLAQLDPTMAKFYASDMVTRKDLWNRQNKLDDLAAAHAWQEYLKNAYGRGGRGGGGGGGSGSGGGRRGRTAAEYGGVNTARYNFAVKYLKDLDARIDKGYKPTPQEQQKALMAERIRDSYDNAMFGLGGENQEMGLLQGTPDIEKGLKGLLGKYGVPDYEGNFRKEGVNEAVQGFTGLSEEGVKKLGQAGYNMIAQENARGDAAGGVSDHDTVDIDTRRRLNSEGRAEAAANDIKETWDGSAFIDAPEWFRNKYNGVFRFVNSRDLYNEERFGDLEA